MFKNFMFAAWNSFKLFCAHFTAFNIKDRSCKTPHYVHKVINTAYFVINSLPCYQTPISEEKDLRVKKQTKTTHFFRLPEIFL